MNSKRIALLFAMLSLGGMLVPGLTLTPVSAQLRDSDELVDNNLLGDLGITEEEKEDGEDGVIWCYQRQGDETVCFNTQEQCEQALAEDDLSTTSHCERFETLPQVPQLEDLIPCLPPPACLLPGAEECIQVCFP